MYDHEMFTTKGKQKLCLQTAIPINKLDTTRIYLFLHILLDAQ